jgi:hypothetical protein
MRTCPKCGEVLEDQFDSCWKCAGLHAQSALVRTRLKTPDYLKAAAIAYLVPWLALCFQSAFAWWRPLLLVGIDIPLLLWMTVPATMNFALLLPFLRSQIASRLVAAILLVGWIMLFMCLSPRGK